jgi:hypothetical protein
MGNIARCGISGIEILGDRCEFVFEQRKFCLNIGDELMALKRLATSIAVIAALTLPALGALAQGVTSYYIVQDVKTKKCAIVDKKPVATEATVVGPDGVVYKTRTEAETALKTVKVCTTS